MFQETGNVSGCVDSSNLISGNGSCVAIAIVFLNLIICGLRNFNEVVSAITTSTVSECVLLQFVCANNKFMITGSILATSEIGNAFGDDQITIVNALVGFVITSDRNAATSNGNHTMARMIAQSAADMAERTKGDADVSRSYRLVSHRGKGLDGGEYLQAFDCLCRTFDRCERNFALSTKWDELTTPVVESF
jgi:hypothetical protein